MDNKIIDLQKILYPEEYETDYIFTYPSFNEELKDLIGKSGYVREFKIKYHKSLRFLEQLRTNCIMQRKVFEKLLNAQGMYSIILKGEKNLRIIFDFQAVNGKEIAVLYTCFQEKRTKDYSQEIKEAQHRSPAKKCQ